MTKVLCAECAATESELAAACRVRQSQAEAEGEMYVCTCPPIVCVHLYPKLCVACGVHPQEPYCNGLCFACDRDEGESDGREA